MGYHTEILLSRAAFILVTRVHFPFRRKMIKSLIARLPAIQLDLINRPSGETDYITEAIVR